MKKRYSEEQIIRAIKEHEAVPRLATYPRYGYLLLHGLLKREGRVVNKKRTYRLYTEQGLQVRTKQRKKLARRRFRVLNIVDDFSREIVGQLVSVSISGHHALGHAPL